MPQLEVATIVMKDAVNVLIGKQKEGPDAGKWVVPSSFVNEGERMIDTCSRSIIEETGIVVKPKQILFLSEVLEPTHRAAVFCFAEYVSGEPSPGASLTEVKFVDPRTLGDYQTEGMSELTIDAFYKFSMVLKNQALAAAASYPTSGTV
jgi:ADP-ribose pyrophosphatase YjhB (NUDIX family)